MAPNSDNHNYSATYVDITAGFALWLLLILAGGFLLTLRADKRELAVASRFDPMQRGSAPAQSAAGVVGYPAWRPKEADPSNRRSADWSQREAPPDRDKKVYVRKDWLMSALRPRRRLVASRLVASAVPGALPVMDVLQVDKGRLVRSPKKSARGKPH